MKGIGILAVIFGHLTSAGRQFIFSFHMPLFFIIAGFLYRRSSLAERMKRDFKRLIVPYFMTALLIICFYALSYLLTGEGSVQYWIKAELWGSGSPNHTSPLFGNFPYIGAIWFILAMFWCKLIFTVIETYICNITILALASIIISIVTCLMDRYVVNLPLAILPGSAAVVFYSARFLLEKVVIKHQPDIVSGCILVAIWVVATFLHDRHLGMVRCDYPLWPLYMAGGIAATIVLFILIKKIEHLKFFCMVRRSILGFSLPSFNRS